MESRTARAGLVPVAPLARLIEPYSLTVLAQHLVWRFGGTWDMWHRELERIRAGDVSTVRLARADELCTLLCIHLSRVYPELYPVDKESIRRIADPPKHRSWYVQEEYDAHAEALRAARRRQVHAEAKRRWRAKRNAELAPAISNLEQQGAERFAETIARLEAARTQDQNSELLGLVRAELAMSEQEEDLHGTAS